MRSYALIVMAAIVATASSHATAQDHTNTTIVQSGPHVVTAPYVAQAQRLRGLAAAQAAAGDMNTVISRHAAVTQTRTEKAAYLGVAASPASAALRVQTKLPRGIGLVVDVVESNSPADAAGLKQYDILHKLNDQWLVNTEQLMVLIRTFKPGDEVKLTVIRQGESRQFSAKLAEKELPVLGDASPFDPQSFLLDMQRPMEMDLPPGQRALGVIGSHAGLNIVFSDGQGTLNVTSSDGKTRQLIVTDKNGVRIFDGAIDTDEQRKALPKEIADKLRRIERSVESAPARFLKVLTPTTQPSPRPAPPRPGATF